jgi:hypothetical protein
MAAPYMPFPELMCRCKAVEWRTSALNGVKQISEFHYDLHRTVELVAKILQRIKYNIP